MDDAELSVDSAEVQAYGKEDAKKLAVNRFRDNWKIEVANIFLKEIKDCPNAVSNSTTKVVQLICNDKNQNWNVEAESD